MKNLLFKLVWPVAIFYSLGAQSAYYFGFPQTLTQSGKELELRTDFRKTLQQWNTAGDSIALEPNDSYQQLDSQIIARYGVTPQWQIGVGGNYRWNTTTQSFFGGEQESFSRNDFESVFIETKFFLGTAGKMDYALEAKAATRTFSANPPGSSPRSASLALGDAGTYVSVGPLFGWNFSDSRILSGRVLYRNPGEDLSNELFFHSELAMIGKRATILIGAEAVLSLQQDSFTDTPSTKPSLGEGVTRNINSINRQWILPYAAILFPLAKRWSLRLQAGAEVWGRSWDQSFHGSGALVFRQEKNQSILKTRKQQAKFKTYSLQADVTKILGGHLFEINIGELDDVRVKQVFDLFQTDYKDQNIFVARARVVRLFPGKALLKVVRYVRNQRVLKGMVARSR